MPKLLTYSEVDSLPRERADKYRKRVADATTLLAKYDALTCCFDVLEAGQCWGLNLKGRTYLGTYFHYQSDPGLKPTKEELKQRRALSTAETVTK